MKPLVLAIAVVAVGAAAQADETHGLILPLPGSINGNLTSSACTSGYDCPNDPPRTWTLYTQTYGGRIGITRRLTKDECKTQRMQALGQPVTDEEKAAAAMFDSERRFGGTSGGSMVTAAETPSVTGAYYAHASSDIVAAECRDKPLP